MNKKRRSVLQVVLDRLEQLKTIAEKKTAESVLNESIERLEECADDEQIALDSMPESFQWSTRCTDWEENIADLEDAVSEIEIALEACSNTSTYTYEAIKKEIVNAVNSIKAAIHR